MMRRLLLGLLVSLWPIAALAAPINLVRDINRTVSLPETYALNPSNMPAAVGSGWVLALCAGFQQRCDPWFTDGTAAGARKIMSMPPLSGSPTYFTSLGPYVYFFARAAGGGTQIMRTDGTAEGTAIVAAMPYPSFVQSVVVSGTLMYFIAGNGDELWRSDGTEAGTFRLANLPYGQQLAAASGYVYFKASSALSGTELWRTDGTLGGTVQVRDITAGPESSDIDRIVTVGNKVFFWVMAPGAPRLWSSDGTAGGTAPAYQNLAAEYYYPPIVDAGGKAAFIESVSGGGRALVHVDALTNASSSIALPYASGATLNAAAGLVYFIAYTAAAGYELWRSDGTVPGTFMVKDSIPGADGGGAVDVTPVGNAVYYRTTDPFSGGYAALWRTEGTEATTTLVQQRGFAAPRAALGGSRVLLSMERVAWISDGTPGGTRPLPIASGQPSNGSLCDDKPVMAALNGVAFFFADDGVHGCEPWRSDGSESGTWMVKDANPGPLRSFTSNTYSRGLVVSGGNAYFAGYDAAAGPAIWKSDGTAAGTTLVASTNGYVVEDLTAAASVVYFLRDYELWKTDGTPQGTGLVKQAVYGLDLETAVTVGNTLFFTSWSPTGSGQVLWRSDGTNEGTIQLASASYATTLHVVGDAVMYASYDSAGIELWRSDGTVAGTRRVIDLYPGADSGVEKIVGVLGSKLLFIGRTGIGASGLWSTDGTAAGTRMLAPMSSSFVTGGVAIGGVFYFSGSYGLLHRTDGTPEGTIALRYFGSLGGFVAGPGSVFFSATESLKRDLWFSSGTAAGTARVEDSISLTLKPLDGQVGVALASGLFFTASPDEAEAREPYFLPFDAQPDALTFAPKAGVLTNSPAVSDPVQVVGLNIPAPVAASNGEFCVSSANACTCDMAPYATSGAVNYGQFLCVRHSTGSLGGVTKTTNLSIGSIAASFSSTTPSTNPPTLNFAASSYGVSEGGPAISVMVERHGSTSEAVSVRWTTANGSANAGVEFGAPGSTAQPMGVLSWGAGDGTAKAISVGPAAMIPIIDDPFPRVSSFSIQLSNATGGAVVGTAATTRIDIADNENFLTFTRREVSVRENGPNITLEIRRTGDLRGASSVKWAATATTATAGLDFVPGRGGTLNFAPGETLKAIVIGPNPSPAADIPIVNDTLVEPDEGFQVDLSSATGAVLSGIARVYVTIQSDDSGLQLLPPTPVAESARYAYVSVQRYGLADLPASVTYTTANGTALAGTHYTSTSGSLHWYTGDASSRLVAIPILDNSAVNASRTFELRLSGATGAQVVGPASVTITILDDDNTVQFSSPTVTVVEGTPTLSLTVTRLGGTGAAAQASWRTADGTARVGSDFGPPGWPFPLEGTLFWGAGDASPRTVSIPLINDTVVEGAKTFTVSLVSAYGPSLGPVPTVTVTLNDDDSGIMFEAPGWSAYEGAGAMTIQVNRVGVASVAGTVEWTAVNGTATFGQDFGSGGRSTTMPKGTLTWGAGDSGPRFITFTILEDSVREGDETFTIELRSPSPGLRLASPSVTTITIIDNELEPETRIDFAGAKATGVEFASVEPLMVTRTALPGFSYGREVSVSYVTKAGTALAGSDFVAKTGTLTWLAGDSSPKFIVAPTLVNDTAAEPPETVSVALSSPSPGATIGNAEATITIVDDDEIFPSPNFQNEPWINPPAGAHEGWHVSHAASPFEGFRSIRSGTIGDNEKAQLDLTRTFTVAGNVSFRVRVSSEEGFDFLRFYVDGVKKAEWSGTTNTTWQAFSLPLTAGSHTLRWSYEKDGSASMGQDAAWIDALTVPPNAP